MRGVLALDQGSHASRACLFDERGDLRFVASLPVSTQRDAKGFIEQDPAEILTTLRSVLTQGLQQHPEIDVRAAGLATQRSSFLCVRRSNGEPLSSVLSWQDRRHAAWLTSLASSEPRVREISGLPLSPHYGASKMRWCLDHLPAVIAARRSGDLLLTPLSQWLAGQLTGKPATVDPANASRTLLFDSARLDWSPELLMLFGINREELPDCGKTRFDFGTLGTTDSAPMLAAVTGDQSAVPFASGAPDVDAIYINLGTGAFIQRPLLQRPVSPAPLLGSVLATVAAGTLYSLEGTVNGAGSAVSEFAATHSTDEKSLWPRLELLGDPADLPVFINGVGGLGSPWWQPEVQSRFIGEGNAARQFAAVIESIVFMIAVNYRLMATFGRAPARVFVTGGMSRSDWLCRRLASLLGVRVIRLGSEATARGAAALVAPALAANWPSPPEQTGFDPASIAGIGPREQQFLNEVGAWSVSSRYPEQ
jgi:glycerol kinase